MVWAETCLMQEKARYCMAYATGEASMSELCRRFGVSRKTGYRVLARWRWEGPSGLVKAGVVPESGSIRLRRSRTAGWSGCA